METLDALHQCPNRFVTRATWEEYLRFLEAVRDRPIRITYDQGTLEIMSPSHEHERVKTWLGMLVEALLVELGLAFVPGGSMTFRRADLRRGLEPDECYWIQHARAVAALERELDFTQDPPPDLVIEVDVTTSSLDRMELYAALGVPEVWQYGKEQGLGVRRLAAGRCYEPSTSSAIVPRVPVHELTRFIPRNNLVEPAIMDDFRAWLRGL